jgi:hypothetical protein
MTNAKQAYPSIDIVCADRVRRFCLDLGGFRAMEEYLINKHNDPDFSVIEDFDWTSRSIETLSVIMFAGFYTDSKKDSEPFTVEKAEKITSMLGLVQAKGCIEESLSRMMTPKQYAKVQEETEKKREKRKKIREAIQKKKKR